jgi:hypothetical protein
MKEIKTLIWSEWRRQRKAFFLLLAAIVSLYILMKIILQLKLQIYEMEVIAAVLSLGLPLLHAIVLGDSFAAEFSNKSSSFILGLPISKTKIYFIKYISSLLLFLLVSIVGTLIMYSLTDVKLYSKPFSLAIASILSIWILVHVAVFICNLINRNSKNGVIMLVILPVLLIILVPGIFSTSMFFFMHDSYWLIASIISTILTLYLILLMLGWYLWNTRISRDLKCLNPILMTLGIMFTSSVFVYFCADMYTKDQYNSALKEAQKNNLILQNPENFYVTEVPKALITFSKYIKEHKISRMYLYKKLANRPYSIWKELWEKQKAGTEYLNEPDVRNLYSILEKVSDKYKTQNVEDFYLVRFNTKVAIIFLIDQAYAQARTDKNKVFFKTLRLAAKYCVLLRKIETSGIEINPTSERLLMSIYYSFIKLGQETPACADDYQKALNFIQNKNIYCPPYDLLSHLHHVNSLLNSKSTRNSTFNSMYYRLRAKEGLAAWIRYLIKRNKLYLEAETTLDLKEVIDKNKKLREEAKKIAGYCKFFAHANGLQAYFISRSRFTSDKLCLALKIFRCRYGKYPEKLQDLCPDVLKEIPLVPITQKAYKYKKDKDGFILNSGKFKGRQYGSNKASILRKLYIWKYQPWKEEQK